MEAYKLLQQGEMQQAESLLQEGVHHQIVSRHMCKAFMAVSLRCHDGQIGCWCEDQSLGPCESLGGYMGDQAGGGSGGGGGGFEVMQQAESLLPRGPHT